MSTPAKRMSRVGRASDKRCPKCGSALRTNDYGQEWCLFLGDRDRPACHYGIAHDADCPAGRRVSNECDCGYAEASRDKLTTEPETTL